MKRVVIFFLIVVVVSGFTVYFFNSQHVNGSEQDYVVMLGRMTVQALITRDRQFLAQTVRNLEVGEEGIYYEYKSERIKRGYLHPESEIGELSFVKVVDRNTIMMEYVTKRDNFDGVGLVGLTFVRGRDGWKLTQLQYDI